MSARRKGKRARHAGWSSDHHLFVTQTRCKAVVPRRAPGCSNLALGL